MCHSADNVTLVVAVVPSCGFQQQEWKVPPPNGET
jgi:hypothetical protein